jgi:catechol 2,3-dioxygenase-like lactoylglutathione lyase family enzyme
MIIKNFLFLFLLSISLSFAQHPHPPIMLDDIHYYIYDRAKMNDFLNKNFKTKAMKEVSDNPLTFIDFLEVRNGQSTLNISPKGPFEGMKVADPKRWEKENVIPSPDNNLFYGIHWLALTTKNLKETLKLFKENGIKIENENVDFPYSGGKCATIWTPEYNRILLIERKNDSGKSDFSIDHLLILVTDLEKNIQFYKDVFAGKIESKKEKIARMTIGKHTFYLAEPEALYLNTEMVRKRDTKKFIPYIDHIGFLYENVTPAYEYAQNKGYQFALKPTPMNFFDKPTLYSFAITFSPDGLQCEMYQEKGRTKAKTIYKE